MPRVILPPECAPLSLEEATALLDSTGFDPASDASLNHAARVLTGLAANRTFLGDIMIAMMLEEGGERTTSYGPQAIMLSPPANGYFLRANIWPARGDPAYVASGPASFVYGLPHDHNFDFLTIGYFGPGYVSDYYEYDYTAVEGVPGEAVDLRFVERSALSAGRVLHYRAHRDVHRQHPPQSLSVSLNICAAHPAQGWFDQYRFDIEEGRIAGVLNPTANEVMLRIGMAMESKDARALAAQLAADHPSAAMRRTAKDLVKFLGEIANSK